MDRLQAITAHLTGMRLIAASVVPMATAAVSSISRPIRVCVTGAAGQIAYSLIPMIGSGAMFGSNQPVVWRELPTTALMCRESLSERSMLSVLACASIDHSSVGYPANGGCSCGSRDGD